LFAKSRVSISQDVLGRTNRLLSFHYNFSISYDKQKETLVCMRNEANNTFRETAVLVLLVGQIYEVRVEVASGGMVYISSFMKTGTGVQEILRI
jgi:hypothetical protein